MHPSRPAFRGKPSCDAVFSRNDRLMFPGFYHKFTHILRDLRCISVPNDTVEMVGVAGYKD